MSATYALVQHHEVADRAIASLIKLGVKVEELVAEIGLTELEEWMTLALFLPEQFSWNDGSGPVKLRLECSNSVDGTASLVLYFGWFRFVCSNGLVIGRSLAEFRDHHNRHLNLAHFDEVITAAVDVAREDLARLQLWRSTTLRQNCFVDWVDSSLANAWGKKAACRTFHICASGKDVEFLDRFNSSRPSEKPVRSIGEVPGAPVPARTIYDVAQALSWIASRRKDADERLAWQMKIPSLVDALATQKAETPIARSQ